MCIQAIAKCLQGDLGGAIHAEANSWGLGGASAGAGACAGKGGSIHASASWSEGHGSHGAFGAASRHGAYEGDYGRGGGSFERTTTQTRVGADGSVTQKTTHVSSGGASGYSGLGYAGEGRGYGNTGFDSHGGARGYGDHARLKLECHSGSVDGFAQSGSLAGGGSFAAASASIMPAGPLAFLMNLFGGANRQAA